MRPASICRLPRAQGGRDRSRGFGEDPLLALSRTQRVFCAFAFRDLHDRRSDAEGLAAGGVDRKIARQERARAFGSVHGELDVWHGDALVDDLPEDGLDRAACVAQHLVDAAADVLLGRHSVQRRQGVIDPNVPQLLSTNPSPTRELPSKDPNPILGTRSVRVTSGATHLPSGRAPHREPTARDSEHGRRQSLVGAIVSGSGAACRSATMTSNGRQSGGRNGARARARALLVATTRGRESKASTSGRRIMASSKGRHRAAGARMMIWNARATVGDASTIQKSTADLKPVETRSSTRAPACNAAIFPILTPTTQDYF
jgi:hypothetical protein